MQYEPIIGLEVHAQLLTRSKMFCECKVNFGDRPNTNICPVCMGLPGALPVTNKGAVELAIRVGLAVGAEIQKISTFARKNYFYPDLPKGYQISQYDYPLCKGGWIEVDGKRIGIIRVHLEEDAGKLLHELPFEETRGRGDPNASYVDFNRSGVPLIEIVSSPDIRSPQEGILYLKTLRSILMYLDVCDGNMQEGSFRCDANISLRPVGKKEFGTRTELKNMNSFKAIERALTYEIERQKQVLASGGMVEQETLLWDESAGKTESMRGKEEAHDYRYFPEPDLPPLVVDEQWIKRIKASLPELREARMRRFIKDLGIPRYDANVLTEDKALASFYEAAVGSFNSPKKIANWIMTELMRELKGEEISRCKVAPKQLARLVELVETGSISGKIAKVVFGEMYKTGQEPDEIVKHKGLAQVTDEKALEGIIDEVLAKGAENVAKYKAGKVGLFGYFVGEVMKATKGQADPKIVNELLKKKLRHEA